MRIQKNKSKNKKVAKGGRRMPLIIKIAVFWIVGYLAFSIGAAQLKLMSLDSELKSIEAQVAIEEKRAQELADTKGKSDTPAFKERMAREKLGFLMPDEKVFIDATAK